MKYITNIILAVFISLFTLPNLYGQSFMRYKMKDGSFNGFYTSCIDSISHVTENGIVVSKVYYGDNIKTIPVDNIIDISFEGATLSSGQDVREYNIVEFEGKEGFKKAYVDNRATLIASKTGDFFANDTILIASAYNNIKCLFFTDNDGRITRFFDGENYLIFDNDDEVFVVNDFSDTAVKSTRGVGKVIWQSLRRVLENKKVQAALKVGEISASYLVENLDAIANDPELHSQRLIVAGLSLAGALIDPFAYVSSILATLDYNDNYHAKLIDDFYGGISGSFMDLINEMYPDPETIEKYKEFYANKYKLYLSALSATDITATSATLNGSIYTEDGLRGDLYFCFHEVYGEGETTVSVTEKYDKVNEWKLEGFKSNLKPDTWYMYYLKYVCSVDRLQLNFTSEPVDFNTPKPFAYTGEAHNITSNSAIVDCEFQNAEGLQCSIHYSAEFADGGNEQGVVSTSNGKQSIPLSGLVPYTTYTYYAIIEFGENVYKGESKTFTTQAPDLSGTWNCKETHYDYADNPYYITYNLTLNEDGTVEDSRSTDVVSSSWSYFNSGEVRIRVNDIATLTQNSGTDWNGTVDNISAPTKITGYTNDWNYNQYGSFTGEPYKFEMTR